MLPSKPPSVRPSLEVADIFRGESASFLRDYGHRLSSQQKRVFSDIRACRTAVMGGHVRACDHCGHHEISYNSCRNRHCPKCQAMARAEWLMQREAELLPIAYFHIIFTLPSEIAAVSRLQGRANADDRHVRPAPAPLRRAGHSIAAILGSPLSGQFMTVQPRCPTRKCSSPADAEYHVAMRCVAHSATFAPHHASALIEHEPPRRVRPTSQRVLPCKGRNAHLRGLPR